MSSGSSSATVLPPKSPSSTKLVIREKQKEARTRRSMVTTTPVSTVRFGKDDVHLEEMKVAVEETEVLESFMYEALSPAIEPEELLPEERRTSIASNFQRSNSAFPPRAPDQEIDRPGLIDRCRSDPSTSHSTIKSPEQPMISLADDCVRNGDVATGIALYQCVLKEQEKKRQTREEDRQEKHGGACPKTATTLHKLGEAHLAIGKLEIAAGFFQEALTIRATAYGTLNQSVADSLVHYGAAKLGLKHLDQAHDAYRRALRIHQKLHGVHHANVGHIHTQLGCIHYEMGELVAANAAFEDALDVYNYLSQTSSSNRKVWMGAAADALCNIGSIKLKKKKYERAMACFGEALGIQKQIYGPYHQSVIASLDNIAYGQCKSRRYSLATQTYEQMLHTQLTYHKVYNIACYETLTKLSFLYEKTNNFQCAIDVTLEAHALQRRTLSHTDPVYLKTQKMLQRLKQKLAPR